MKKASALRAQIMIAMNEATANESIFNGRNNLGCIRDFFNKGRLAIGCECVFANLEPRKRQILDVEPVDVETNFLR